MKLLDYLTRLIRPGDEMPDEISTLSPQERLKMMWLLACDACAFTGCARAGLDPVVHLMKDDRAAPRG